MEAENVNHLELSSLEHGKRLAILEHKVNDLETSVYVRLNELHTSILELSDRVDTLEELTRDLRGRHGRPID